MSLPEQIDRLEWDCFVKRSTKKTKRRYLRRKYRQNEWQWLYCVSLEDIDEVPPANKCYSGWTL